ncbi:putative protein-serine/threonine phosphatase [Rosa chinensis]|uniref:Aminotransferase-like plant mobile domain-containing protein n=1 Tax=Rosa chinensis TaxID=74649 RepID=A0A2P6QC25_ROSCH|nr:uncharacterized protein LOC112203666 [Rosa chinensis]PRQ31734.1 putative protein-serine/threonine phosphatase [Rosa chinensis]
MNEEKEMAMVSPTGEDPFRKEAYFLKPIIPNSSIDEPFKLPQGFTSLPPRFDPKNWPLKLRFRGWRLDHQDLQTWVAHLAPIHQSTWKKAGIFEAIFNSTYQIKRKKDLLCGFAEKWCCETNTFIFPWGEATITLEDVMVLGGFSVLGDSIFSPLESRELREIEEKLEKERKGLYDYFVGCRNACTTLWMQKFMKSGSELEHEAFLVFWLSRYVFHNTPNSSVNKAVFSIAIRLARGIPIALAPAVLAHIYRDLSMLKMTIVASNGLNARNEIVDATIMSPFHLVQVWAWERFVELRPIPNVISCAEPRLARWDKVDCLNVGNMRSVLDKAGEGFIRRPYTMAIKNCVFPAYYVEMEKWVLVGPNLGDEHDLMSFAMFLRVAELVGFGTRQKYLPHRVARQFGFNQDIPCSSVAGHSHSFENAKLYVPSKLSETDTSMRCLSWWQESESRLEQKSIPLKKKPKKAVEGSKEANKIFKATIACDYSPKNSEKVVQVSTRRNDDSDNLVALGFPPTCNEMNAADPMDEDALSISEVLKHSKIDETVETKESGDCEKLSDQVQDLVYSSVEKGTGNTVRSEGTKKVLKTEALTGASKAKCNLLKSSGQQHKRCKKSHG